jgi:hypothetical protein
MPQRSVASTYTFEQQRTEINLLAADFWSQKTDVDNASSTYLKHNGSNDFTGGTLNVPNAFTISSNSGNGTVTIAGNLQVDGTTTTVNTATMDVVDKNITIAKGSANDAAADGAGITIDSATDITLNFVDANDAWVSSIGLEATTFLKGPYGQFTGSGTPATGQGVEVNAPDANTGQITSYDRTNSAYKELRLKGSSVGVYTGTTNALEASFNSSGLSVEGLTTAKSGLVVGSADQSKAQDGVIIERNSNAGIAHITAGRSGGNYSGFEFYVAGASGVTKRLSLDYQGNQHFYKEDGTTSQFYIKNDGKVGIGVTSLTAQLTIDGASQALASEGTLKIQAPTEGADVGGGITFGNSVARRAAIVGKQEGAGTNTAGYLAFGTRATSGDVTERFRIGSTGNTTFTGTGGQVHTFTSDSYNVLDIIADSDNNEGNSDNIIRFRHGSGGSLSERAEIRYDESDGHLELSAGDNLNHLVIKPTGNIGISEVSPDNKLHITTTSSSAYSTNISNTQNLTNALLKLQNLDGSDGTGVNNYVGIQFAVANGATSSAQLNYVRTADNSGRFAFKARNGGGNDYPNLMDITSAGRVGINQTDPASTLHVENKSTGTTEADKRIAGFYKPSTSSASDREGYIHIGSWSSHYGVKLGYYNEGASPGYHNAGFFVSTINSNQGIDNHTKKLVVDSIGRVLIGTDSSSSSAKLAVNGSITGTEAFFELNRTDDPANNQNIGCIEFSQGDAASRNAARIVTRRDGGVWGAASLPTRFEFHACNSGSNSPTERMRITSDGAVQMEYLNPADGSTAARAARSAVEIKKYYPNSPTGNYWIIAPNGQGAKQIRCDMETDGGGWMLWYAHNSYGSNNMNEQCGGDSASPSSHIAASNMGNYVNYTCWMEASKIDNGDRQMIDSFVQLDQNGQIRYKADYGEQFFPEEVGNPFDPQYSACFTSGDAEWWGGNDMYPPTCGVTGGNWQAFSGGGWSRVWIREPESDISPGTVRTCHGIPRVYGRDTNGVPSWHLHESAIIMPYWSEMTYLNGAVANGNSQWTSNNGRAIGNTTISNNGPCVQGRLKGYLTGEFEIKFNLGYEWGWSVLALGNSRSHEARSRDPITWGNVYNHGTDIKGAYTMHNNSSNNHWMPAYRSGDGIWNEVQHSGGAPQNVDQFMWRESDGTIRIRRSDGTHGTYTYPIKWAGPFMVTSAHQSPCYINIQEITDGGSWSKWYK